MNFLVLNKQTAVIESIILLCYNLYIYESLPNNATLTKIMENIVKDFMLEFLFCISADKGGFEQLNTLRRRILYMISIYYREKVASSLHTIYMYMMNHFGMYNHINDMKIRLHAIVS